MMIGICCILLKLREIMVFNGQRQIVGSGSTRIIVSPTNSALRPPASFERGTDKMGQCLVSLLVLRNKGTNSILGTPFALYVHNSDTGSGDPPPVFKAAEG